MIILHIDMNSFFASAEQQANPLLRSKPIVVSGKEGTRSVIVAASKEAKVFGIKTAMLQSEARSACPHLIFVEPDGEKYDFLHRELVEILKRYTEMVEVFSIDEAFLDLSGYAKNFEDAEKIAKKIKLEIKNNLGECMTCSIGIAENKLLAKLASDLKKPDGLIIINDENKKQILEKIKLTDFCGLGRGYEKRLNDLGVDTVKKLQEFPLDSLIEAFGPAAGNRLREMSFGKDDTPVVSYLFEAEAKSVGRSYTLPQNTYDKNEIFTVLAHLCEKTGRELRRNSLAGRTLVYYLRYNDFTGSALRKTLSNFTNDSLKLFQIGFSLLNQFKLLKPVRLVGVHVSNLASDCKQLPLWEKDRKQLALLPFLDKINDTYGELTIKPAFLLKSKRLRKHVGGFKSRESAPGFALKQ
ncbi:MAG: DNA polymerase IV [Parcubacteria group bacterium]